MFWTAALFWTILSTDEVLWPILSTDALVCWMIHCTIRCAAALLWTILSTDALWPILCTDAVLCWMIHCTIHCTAALFWTILFTAALLWPILSSWTGIHCTGAQLIPCFVIPFALILSPWESGGTSLVVILSSGDDGVALLGPARLFEWHEPHTH
jgi:hypothetical protein